MKKQPERTNATRSMFVDAFIELNKHKVVEKITIQELADKAGYNRATFYEYFGDIYGLMAYMEDTIIAYIKKEIVNRIGNLPVEDLFVKLFTDMYQEHQKYLRILFDEGNYARFSQKLKTVLVQEFSAKMQLVNRDKKMEYMLDFYLSGMISVVAKWFTSEQDMSVEEFATLVRTIVDKIGMLFIIENT